jgi:primary-amine oxidase
MDRLKLLPNFSPIRIFLLALLVVFLMGGWMAQNAKAIPSTARLPLSLHPLSPLSETEIKTAVQILRTQKSLGDHLLLTGLTLQEPPKEAVLNYKAGERVQRQVMAIALDRPAHKTYEAVIDLSSRAIASWREIPGAQPALMDTDYEQSRAIVKADPHWKEAMRQRGITDLEQVAIEFWAPGNLTPAEKALGVRLIRAIPYYKGMGWNYYGSPIEGVVLTIDITHQKVVGFVDSGVTPFSKQNWDYDEATLGKLNPPLKRLNIRQPDGVNFTIQDNEVTWQNWKFRFLMHPREGLTLYTVRYVDDGVERPVLYRGGLSEMVVPYGDTDPTWTWRSAFDVGEYQLGVLAVPLRKGGEVPENATLLNVLLTDETGEPYTQENTIGLYERDGGMLWKHYEYNTDRNDIRRARDLVLTTMVAVGNYDYGISWIFHQDGTLEVQTDLTGIILAKAIAAETQDQANSPYGRLVQPNIIGNNHQHFFNFRLDLDVDGAANLVEEMNIDGIPKGTNNSYGNGMVMTSTPLPTEQSAVGDLKPGREWFIASANKKGKTGMPTGYMLMPSSNMPFLPVVGANIRERSGFATHPVWFTQYHPAELNAGGAYPNQSVPDQGLPNWIENNESIESQDLVLWYSLGITHAPRPEDWPVMPVHRAGFKLMPVGFFDQNPVLKLAPTVLPSEN